MLEDGASESDRQILFKKSNFKLTEEFLSSVLSHGTYFLICLVMQKNGHSFENLKFTFY